MTFAIQFFLVMVALIVVDLCWTMYFVETEKRNAVKAGLWSALIMLSGSYATVSFVEDKRLIIAAFIGAFIGTYSTIKWVKRRKD